MSLNKVELLGRICNEINLRYTQNSNTAVARFSLAVDRNYQKDKNNKETDFINIVAFGKNAEFIQKYFQKGSQIVIVGRIQTGSYEKDNKKVYTFDVVAEEQYFAGSKQSGQAQSTGNTSTTHTEDGFELDEGFSLDQIDEGSLPF